MIGNPLLPLLFQTQPPGDGLQSTLIFEQLQQLVTTAPDIVQKVKAIFLWNITKDGKTVAQWSKP